MLVQFLTFIDILMIHCSLKYFYKLQYADQH